MCAHHIPAHRHYRQPSLAELIRDLCLIKLGEQHSFKLKLTKDYMHYNQANGNREERKPI